MRTLRQERDGFALMVTLWALVGCAALAASAFAIARNSLGTARNRANQSTAYWLAAGCTERARSAIQETLWPDGYSTETTEARWTTLDQWLAGSERELGDGCGLRVEPAGVRADVNSISRQQLYLLLVAARLSPATADSLADALADWRDADDAPRASGAEADWYRAHALPEPRNGPVMANEEIFSIRGFAEHPGLARFLAVDRDRILWTRAPLPVLTTLPGFGDAVSDGVSDGVSTDSVRALVAAVAHASRLAMTDRPDVWIITASVTVGQPPITVSIETRFVLADARVIAVNRVIRP